VTLSSRQKLQLYKIIAQVEKILKESESSVEAAVLGIKPTMRKNVNGKLPMQSKARIRRSPSDAAAMKKDIQAARRKGAAVAELAKKYGVTPSYIYQMR
jgi:parvulin-like peptidyl-prolyl isomerase